MHTQLATEENSSPLPPSGQAIAIDTESSKPLDLTELASHVLEQLSVPICVLDTEGRMLLLNKAYRDFTQATASDAFTPISEFQHLSINSEDTRDDGSVQFQIRRLLSGEIEQFVCDYSRHVLGDTQWYRVSATRLVRSSSACAVLMYQAIMRSKFGEFEHRDDSDTGRMPAALGILAHDFNNALCAVLGGVKLARAELSANHTKSEAVERIHQATQYAMLVVRDYLNVCRGGPRPLQLQLLGPIVEQAMATLRESLPLERVLDTQISATPIWVYVNAIELQRALINLVHNAWHALAPSGGRIQVGVGLGLSDDDEVCIWVQDNGRGMSKAVQARIFEPYFTTRGRKGGTGLGLSQVEDAMVRMGGRIGVNSEIGQGSRFDLYLPLGTPATCANKDNRSPPYFFDDSRPTPRHLRAGLRVLLVDDDEVVGMTLQALLENSGCIVTLLKSGPLAFAYMCRESHMIDVLITDQNMPNMSGLDLCLAVRRLRSKLPLVLITGFVDDEVAHQVSRLENAEIVGKDVATDEIIPIVWRLTT